MHRIPLILPSPSAYWDTNMPEYKLLRNTLNAENIEYVNNYNSSPVLFHGNYTNFF